MKKKTDLVPDEIVMNKIYLIRGQKVMLDADLAELYGVETKQLKRAVRRNRLRFPEDFMFELNKKGNRKLEVPIWHLKLGRGSLFANGIYRKWSSDVIQYFK
jgi:hypothetical protein